MNVGATDPHPPIAGAMGPSLSRFRERGSMLRPLAPLPLAGEGAERSEAGEG
jgi:hypothetical protein